MGADEGHPSIAEEAEAHGQGVRDLEARREPLGHLHRQLVGTISPMATLLPDVVPSEVLIKDLDSGEKSTSDLSYKQPESTKSSGQREQQAQACENMLRTRPRHRQSRHKGSHSLNFGRMGLRQEGKPLALSSGGFSGLIGR